MSISATPTSRNNAWPDVVKNMAGNFIRQAKDQQLSVEQVRDLLDVYGEPLPLAEMCYAIYDQYEMRSALPGRGRFSGLDPAGAARAATGPRITWRGCDIAGPTFSKMRRRTAASCRSGFCDCWSATRATGCAWATLIRRFTRPSPPPTRNICAAFLREKGVQGKNCPTPGAARPALSSWQTI